MSHFAGLSSHIHWALAVTESLMVRYSFLFFIVFLVGLLVEFSGQSATSVVPGWHTTIYSPWFLVGIFQLLWLGIASAIYFFLELKGLVVSRKLFILHTFLSLLVFFDYGIGYFVNITAEFFFVVLPLILFLLGQVVFVVGAIKAEKTTA